MDTREVVAACTGRHDCGGFVCATVMCAVAMHMVCCAHVASVANTPRHRVWYTVPCSVHGAHGWMCVCSL